jgi:hypothetical protein
MSQKKVNATDTMNDISIQDVKYIVKRNGIRVSEEIHMNYNDAVEECEYWRQIVNRWPDGSKVEIETVEYEIVNY